MVYGKASSDGDGSADESGDALGAGARRTLGGIGRRLTDLMFPAVCLACRGPLADADALCCACWSAVDFITPPLCDRLGIPLPFDAGPGAISGAAIAEPPNYDRARAVATYGPVVKQLVHAFKYHDRHDARRMFGRWLTVAGAELIREADVVVPVPLHRWRLLSRRFNQSAILAKEVARAGRIPFAPMALVRTKHTPPQVDMPAEERRSNVAGAFAVPAGARRLIEGRRVLLIDDVITTGATCNAAASALLRAKAARVDVLALAIATHTV